MVSLSPPLTMYVSGTDELLIAKLPPLEKVQVAPVVESVHDPRNGSAEPPKPVLSQPQSTTIVRQTMISRFFNLSPHYSLDPLRHGVSAPCHPQSGVAGGSFPLSLSVWSFFFWGHISAVRTSQSGTFALSVSDCPLGTMDSAAPVSFRVSGLCWLPYSSLPQLSQ